ncbi:MAG: hypothetical protein A2096_05270 [Spirochaetes bacterium GWF1_41_5]|nr:MAG: hypothetical protein A2096_05270 [Spirochaetes bacterium GWF1_41_5]
MSVYALINSSRNRLYKQKKPTNHILFNFISNNFFQCQLMGIRRIIDEYPLQSENNKKDVYSLMSLFNDMKKNKDTARRELLFDFLQLPYDYNSEYKKEEQAMDFPDELIHYGKSSKAHVSEHLHKLFDLMAGVNSFNRSKNDVFSETVLESFRKYLNEITKKTKAIVDKELAHAATPKSRDLSVHHAKNDLKITFSDIKEIQKNVSRIAALLINLLTGNVQLSFLPLYGGDKFYSIEHQLFGNISKTELGKMWDEFQNEVKEWSNWNSLCFDSIIKQTG